LAGKYAPFDWTKMVFTDESSFVLGTRGWVWRRRAETGPEVRWTTYKFPLIAIESSTVNAESDVDDFGDQSRIILDMRARHGPQKWTHMPDGDSDRGLASKLAGFEPDRKPVGHPETTGWRAETGTKDALIQVLFDVREALRDWTWSTT
jgi:hypothetical protein